MREDVKLYMTMSDDDWTMLKFTALNFPHHNPAYPKYQTSKQLNSISVELVQQTPNKSFRQI